MTPFEFPWRTIGPPALLPVSEVPDFTVVFDPATAKLHVNLEDPWIVWAPELGDAIVADVMERFGTTPLTQGVLECDIPLVVRSWLDEAVSRLKVWRIHFYPLASEEPG
jgi:hypothetical protein